MPLRSVPHGEILGRDSAFVYDSLPSRVVFRAGALDELAEETARLGSRVFIISTPGQRRLGRTLRGAARREHHRGV